MAIGNSAGSYYMIYNVRAPEMLPYFMALGSIPAFIFMPMVPAIKRAIGKSKCFMYSFQSLYWVWHCCILFLWFRYSKRRYGWSFVAQFIKSTGVIIATGYMWAFGSRSNFVWRIYSW